MYGKYAHICTHIVFILANNASFIQLHTTLNSHLMVEMKFVTRTQLFDITSLKKKCKFSKFYYFKQVRKLLCLFVCVEVLRPTQQLRSCRVGQLPINTVPGQA